jgi:DDE domain
VGAAVTPLLADAARFCRHAPGDRWFVDETYVKVNGVWRYVYRAIDQYGQVIDVLVSTRRDADAARRFFRRALATLKVTPTEVATDAAAVYPGVLDELIPPRGITSSSTRTIRSRPITAASNIGCAQCAGYELIGQRRWSSPGTPLCRISGAATTSSDSTSRLPTGWPQRSANSPRRSDLGPNRGSTRPLIKQRNSASAPTGWKMLLANPFCG